MRESSSGFRAAIAMAALVGGSLAPMSAPQPHREVYAPQPKIGEGQKRKNRIRNRARAIENGRPANYDSLPAKQKAKYRKKKR